MSHPLRRIALLAGTLLLSVVGLQGATGAPATAVPCGTGCYPGPQYKVIDVHTYNDDILYQLGSVASCRNAGGTCTITRVESRTTTISTGLGLSKGAVAASIGFQVGYTSSTSVSCTSPKLKQGQVFRAYVVGTTKMYKIQRTYAGHTDTTGYLFARQPKKADIYCHVY
ncbi:MAG TPA: hypothetical protein VF416_05000 [Marmoricola sp.]